MPWQRNEERLKTFEYRGFNGRGQVRRGLVEALSLKGARERLAADGVLAERVTATGRQIRLPATTRSAIYRELGALLGAGLPLVKALDILVESPDTGDPRLCLAGVRDRVREGGSLADAVAEASPSVTGFEKAIIEAAERSATVTQMLERLAGFLEEQEAVRQQIQSALIYPSVVVAVGVCVAGLMLGLLIPRTRDLLDSGGVAMPGLTTFMIGFGRAAIRWAPPLLVLVAAAAFGVRHQLKKDAGFRRSWDRYIFRLPVVGRGYRLLVNERFCRTIAILLEGGVSVLDGLVLAGRATGSAWVTELTAAQAEFVRHGDRLSDAVRRIPPLATFLPGWIRIGEAGGGMARLLDNAGRRYGAQRNRFVKLCLSFLEPTLILMIGGFVLLITVSILLPVLNLSRAL